MQELEKTLLKETEQLVNMHYEDDSVKTIILRNLRDIRKHMSGKDTGVPTNDGWIPVDKQLPENNGDNGKLIVTDKDDRIWTEVYYGIAEETDKEPCFHKWDEEMWHCYKPDVIAWRPLPEPYCPERSDGHAR